jgi:hypothetical protein
MAQKDLNDQRMKMPTTRTRTTTRTTTKQSLEPVELRSRLKTLVRAINETPLSETVLFFFSSQL